jgi:predicted nucleic acid-binding protein
MSNHVVAERLSPLLEAGLVATCGVLDAEALSSARSADEYEALTADRIAACEYVSTNDEHWQAALNAQRLLARRGRHRSVGIADLLTSVLAGVNQLTVLHYDVDFEVAATVLEFEQRWVAARGTL